MECQDLHSFYCCLGKFSVGLQAHGKHTSIQKQTVTQETEQTNDVLCVKEELHSGREEWQKQNTKPLVTIINFSNLFF